MTKKVDITVPICPVCQRKTIYFRKDNSIKCRACGFDSQKAAMNQAKSESGESTTE